ncbi:MAG TPA: hypothetical protein VIH79_04980 [Candidatus Nanopelagicaceae bacterium]
MKLKKYSRIGFSSLMLLFASIGLIAWIIYLMVSLPTSYRANHWDLAWVGFDIGMAVTLLITSWALWKRRQIAIPAAMVSATFLIVDAWFDVATSEPGWDLDLSIILAIVSMTFAVQLLRFSRKAIRQSIRNAYEQAGKELLSDALWKTPLMIFEQESRRKNRA